MPLKVTYDWYRYYADVVGKRPKAVGVIFNDENGKQHEAMLGNHMQSQVILSSGAIGSPQMLLLKMNFKIWTSK
jgi:hypothetical protein